MNEIISVYDTLGDEYYEVESLTQNVVYKRTANSRKHSITYQTSPRRNSLTKEYT